MAVRKPVYASVHTNTIKRSEEFDSVVWSKLNSATVTANTTTAPDGTTTADTITFAAVTNSGLNQAPVISQISGNDYTFSVWIKRIGGTDTDINLLVSDGLGSTVRGKTATADWTRVEATRTSTNNAVGAVQIRNATTSVQSVYVWGAQFEEGSFASSYIPTTTTTGSVVGDLKEMTTAMVNEIVDQTVYQYSLSPSVALSVVSSGGSLGTLADTRLQAGAVSNSSTAFPNEATTAEPTTVTVNFAKITSADASVSPTADTGKTWPVYLTSVYTNLSNYSEQFDNAYWSKSRSTVSTNAGVAPDGTTTADKLIPNSGLQSASSVYILRVVAGSSYTYSVYAKPDGCNFVTVNFQTGGSGSTQGVRFNVSTGAVDATQNANGTIIDAGNGWYRCSMTPTTTTATVSHMIAASDGGSFGTYFNTPVTGDGTKGILIWGAQYEAGDLTSYIPTTTTAKSAGGDFKSMSLADIKDTFLHPAIDLLVSGSTGTQQGGTYHISTATSVGGSTEVSGSNTPIFTDTRADTSLYSAAGIPEALDQPTTISNYYLHKITGSDTSYTLPIFTTATNQIQSYPEATFESLLQEWIRNTATSSGDGYEINYSYTTGTNRGSGMGDTTLNGTGDYQTLQVGDDYRAQEFPNGTAVTTNTYYLKINKS